MVVLKIAVISKPIAILVLGCLPLAALTVASFAGLGDLDRDLPSIDAIDLTTAGGSPSLPSPDGLEGDQALAEAVVEREFFAGGPLPENALAANPSHLNSLVSDWKHWSDATDLVGEVLAVEESLVGAELAQLESARDRFEKIQADCRKKAPAGSARLLRVLDRRGRELQDEIGMRRKRVQADKLLRDAESACRERQYDEGLSLYQQVLREYSAVIDVQAVEERLRTAKFWHELEKLPLESPGEQDLVRRRDSLVRFLDDYSGLSGGTEQEKLREISGRLEAVRLELRQAEMNDAARQPIAGLEKYDARPFGEGLATAAQIAEKYPTAWVRGQLQQRVVAWLGRALPRKRLDEPAGIEEVETTSGNILRGFFEPVADAGGGVIGYKSYPTAEERKNPTRNVGRYPAADLRGVPNLSVPRQCVDAYTNAQSRLLADAGNLDCWLAFRRTCESAETALVDYRRKPGSSRESLSFSGEIQFAKNVLMPAVWKQMQAIWEE